MRGCTLFLLLLTCAFHPLTCALHLRILHEPLFPNASLSPTSPPAPFFQAYPSPPSPPPSPPSSSGAGASDPANISSLSVPKPIAPASSTNRRLLAVAVAAFAVAAAVGSATVFCYFRRKRRRPFAADDKPPRSEPAAARNRRARAASGASTEFLYIGNLASSHSNGVDAGDGGGNAIPRLGKLDSPELRPLPPLQQPGFRQSCGRENVEEDFYSPNRSLGGRESSVAAGSAAVVTAENFSGGSSDSSSLSSCSASPTRSTSISISPAMSLSPRSSRPKSQEFTEAACAPPPPPVFGASFGNRSESPSLSSTSSSSENQSPARAIYVPQPPPPPRLPHPSPPPPPPPRYSQPVLRPPVLPAPSKPVMWQNPQHISMPEAKDKIEELPKPKLKPLHWDKVKAGDREMVWDQLKSSSFKVNEEMIETLFMVNGPNLNSKEPSVLPSQNQVGRVLDPKKSQNISILLKALNVTTEKVCEALLEGNPSALGNELIECLLKMAPSKDEECKLKEFEDDSEFKLNPAETFLKAIIGIPFAFKRLDVMLFIANFGSEVESLKKSFETLEAACEELRNSRMFMKLLEAVLKTGNRMNIGTNRGGAQAFKLDTLLKLVDVKGVDGRTTLLHFVVEEIVRTEGARFNTVNDRQASNLNEEARRRKLGLQVVSSISSELANVRRAAAMDSDVLASDLAKIFKGIRGIKEVVRLNESVEAWETGWKFSESMRKFMAVAEDEIIKIQAQESVALSLVKEITEYFHGNSVREEAHPFRIFMVVRDFLAVLDRVCKEVGMIHEQMASRSAAYKFSNPVAQADSGFLSKWRNNSSDDESLSP